MKLISNQSSHIRRQIHGRNSGILDHKLMIIPPKKNNSRRQKSKPCLADGTIINTTHIGDLRTPFTEKRVRIYEKQKVIGILRHASIMILHTPKSQSRNIFFLISPFFFSLYWPTFQLKLRHNAFSVTPASGVTLHFCPCAPPITPNNIGLHPLCSALLCQLT